MDNKIIENYITFALDNGYRNFEIEYPNMIEITDNSDFEMLFEINMYEVITSKPFIEAIARGILKDEKLFHKKEKETNFWNVVRIEFNHINYKTIRYEKYFEDTLDFHKISEQDNLKIITCLQAIAIRENSEDWVSLEEFITNLLPKFTTSEIPKVEK